KFPCTNNMAEYEACIFRLKMAIDMNIKELLVIGDSDLLIHYIQESWAAQNSKILLHLHHIKS
ncbi:reverse transcriptase-like protein, partial [Clostridium perfringens]|nr:reverse transcriptase-like protein [Clostridium perfringens]